MEVLILMIFVGIVLVSLALWFFGWTVRQGSLQHADRLALLPLGRDEAPRSERGTDVEEGKR